MVLSFEKLIHWELMVRQVSVGVMDVDSSNILGAWCVERQGGIQWRCG